MKKKILQNDNGITVCDSIVMSVKRKNINLRKSEATVIAVIGYVSTIMAFLKMFDFNFSKTAFVFSAFMFSVIYITLALIGKKAIWFIITTSFAAAAVSYKFIEDISTGYKFAYNTIYRTAMHIEIDYYKFLKPETEEHSVTVFFILCAWLMAVIIYTFTIYHPNSLPPLIVTFPLIEIGLYNGIEISVFWGMLVIAYWFALFAMTAIDMGEYSGGNGGFVRRDNLFFPKRQMKLKVTEKCGIYIILTVMVTAGLSAAVLNLINYERSDKINKKRIEIRDAVNSFSVEDLAGSISEITSAFGFTFKVEGHKLGNVDQLKYKETTDLIVTVDQNYDGAIYLKEYTGSIYSNNQWLPLSDSAYKDEIFSDFTKYSTYPQDFPYRFNHLFDFTQPEYTIWINSRLRKNKSFAPYGTDNIGITKYDYDTNVSSKSSNEYSYKFTKVEAEDIAGKLDGLESNLYTYSINDMTGEEWKNLLESYCNEKNLINDDDTFYVETELPMSYDSSDNLTKLIQSDYQKFVYGNYLQIPNDPDITEIRNAFYDILKTSETAETSEEKIRVLTDIRNRIASMTEYSLNPGKTPNSRDFVNYFLLENHKGYCTHYATSGVLLARMAGIPARYATGYVIVGDDFNDENTKSDGSYTITLKDNRRHAWVEVYLNGYGWVPFEFTAGYSNQTIDTTPTTTVTTISETTETTSIESSEESMTTTHNSERRNTERTTSSFIFETTITTVTEIISEIPIENSGISKILKYILVSISSASAFIIIIILRRKLVIYIRNKHFTSGSYRKRMAYMYEYTEKLLNYLKISRNDMQYAEFSEYIEKTLGGIYFSPNEFTEFTDTALKSAFSEYPPENDELKKCCSFICKFAKKIYDRANIMEKIYLKIILILI